jgi:ADP-ribose pyrophosphatase
MKTNGGTRRTTTLFRPVGLGELRLIQEAGMRRFPPRLPDQPIFYPVCNREYATQIARDWNAKDGFSGRVEFVLSFDIDSDYVGRFERHIVGGNMHEELWVPAEELDEFNIHIIGEIKVLEVFQGDGIQLDLEPAVLLPREWLSNRNETVVFSGKYCEVRRAGKWEFVARRNVTGVVAILAVTSERCIVLVEQFRAPVNRPVIELPAGLAGDVTGAEHEALVQAAQRELLEETGYAATAFEPLGEGPSSAGITNEIISFFRAHGLTMTDCDIGDGSEKLTVHEVPLKTLPEWLQARRAAGTLVDYKIYAALNLAGIQP